jgi:hypothetical protein
MDSQFITEMHTCMFENTSEVTMRKMINANNILVKFAFFWVITQPLVVISYRRFGPLFNSQESRKILADDPEHFEID